MSLVLDTLRFGARMLRKSPGSTATVLLALSFGIGLPTLMFSLILGALVPTLPFEGGERIVRLQRPDAPVSARDFELWSTRQRSFDGLGAVSSGAVTLGIEGLGTESLSGASVDLAVLPMLGVTPALGRAFTEADALPGAPAVALLGHDVWRDRLGSDPSALGRVVRVNGREAQVIGIMPEGFRFPWNDQVWSPLRVDPLRSVYAVGGEDSGTLSFLVGRLREGVSARAASQDLTELNAQEDLEGRGPSDVANRVEVVAFTNIFSSAGQRAVIAVLMLGVALMVLLVACANVTNVLLARSVVRSREVAIRTAMGASRARIVSQFLAEVGMLAAGGALGGVVIALVGTSIIGNVTAAGGGGMPFWIHFDVDLPVLAFVVVLAGLAAMVAGLAPAVQASRSDAHDLMKDGARGASSFHMGRVMRRLVGVEMALSFVLLVAAGLFIRSAGNFSRVDFAFDPDEVYSAWIRLPETQGTDEARAGFVAEAQEALAGLPEVEGAALASDFPGIGSARSRTFELDGAPTLDVSEGPRARRITVTPGYFDLFRSPVLRGRDFDDGDRAGSLPVAVVNAAFERRYLPSGALQHRVRLEEDRDGQAEWRTIIGVVPDLMAGGVESTVEEAVYVPVAQGPLTGLAVLVRPVTSFATLSSPVRETLAGIDSDVPIFGVQPLRSAIDAANAQYVWLSALFLTAGAIALLLAVIGLYGVMAFWVAQRTREIGVRMALGGERSQIVGLVMRQGMTHTAIGLLVGLALAIPLARLLGAGLFVVSPSDRVVFGSIVGILLGAAWLGCWVPARRATGIDPLEALGEE